MKQADRRQLAGWLAVGFSTIIACFWAFWGILENFHEGWYYDTFLSNIGLMFAQYLSPLLIVLVVTLVSISRPRLGGGLHVILALLAIWFFQAFANPGLFLLILPLIGLGVLYWVGRPPPRRIAISLVLGLPLLTLLLAGIEPALRVSQRLDDGDLQARIVSGNGVTLLWAPAGPGWPPVGGNWQSAQRVCQFLSADGLTLTATEQDIWRVPTAEEAVRSMARHGQNSEGVWDPDNAAASYQVKPDKESPLWDIHSQVIYWWTATEIDEENAFIIAYDGQVWLRAKDFGPDYLGFRCVRDQ